MPADGSIEPIPQPSDDAFNGGGLDSRYLGLIASRQNRQILVKTAQGLDNPKVLQSEENVVIDLSGAFPTILATIVANGGPVDCLFVAKAVGSGS